MAMVFLMLIGSIEMIVDLNKKVEIEYYYICLTSP